MKVTRVLIYEGDPAWIAGTLARGAIAESRGFSCPKGTIREGGLVVRMDDGRPGELPEVYPAPIITGYPARPQDLEDKA